MPLAGFAIPALIGASALGGALSNRSKTATQNSTYNNTSTTTPNVPANQQALYDQMLSLVGNRLRGQTPLQGYEATGLQNINSTSDAIGNSIRNRLVASGTYGSPNANTALNNLDIQRGGQAAQFRNSIPLLQNSLELQNLGAAGTIFGLGPKGQTTTGSGSGTNVTNYPGNVAGGALGGLGSALGFLIGQGAFPGLGGNGTGVPTGVPTLGPAVQTPAPLPPGINWTSLLRGIGGIG